MCNDIPGLIDKIIISRNIDAGNSIIRIGVDVGGGFVKICMSVFEMPSTNEEKNSRKMSLESRFKDSGVKKVMILEIVQEIQENFVNMKRSWIEAGLLNLNRHYTIVTDLKLCNILLGLVAHGSCHPCCWCDVTKDRFIQQELLGQSAD